MRRSMLSPMEPTKIIFGQFFLFYRKVENFAEDLGQKESKSDENYYTKF